MGGRENGDTQGGKGRIWASGSEMPPDSYIPGGRMPCLWWTSSAKCSQAPLLSRRGQAYPGFWVTIMSSPQHGAGLHPTPLLPTHHGWLLDGFRGVGGREGLTEWVTVASKHGVRYCVPGTGQAGCLRCPSQCVGRCPQEVLRGGGRGRREEGGTEEGVSSLSASPGGPVVWQQEPEREGREVGCSAAGWHPVKQQGGSGHCGRQPFSPGTEAPLHQLRMERKRRL